MAGYKHGGRKTRCRMQHRLKIQQVYLDNLSAGYKKSELRHNDRDYQLHDILEFWNSDKSEFVFFEITHIHSGLGMRDGFVCLSVKKVKGEPK